MLVNDFLTKEFETWCHAELYDLIAACFVSSTEEDHGSVCRSVAMCWLATTGNTVVSRGCNSEVAFGGIFSSLTFLVKALSCTSGVQWAPYASHSKQQGSFFANSLIRSMWATQISVFVRPDGDISR